MHYFVSIENTPYFHWQIELLIQSFKNLNLEADLFIAVADVDKPTSMWKFPINLELHSNKFSHFNHECKPLNKINSIIYALTNNIITQPFALLHPDMVLRRPLESDVNLLFDNSLAFNDSLPEILEEDIDQIVAKKQINKIEWFSAGGCMIFNNMLLEFFHEVSKKLEKYDERAAWILTIYEFMGLVSMKGDSFECNLMSNEEKSIIHYKYGLPPAFHKKFFNSKDKFMIAGGSPYQTILENDVTLNTHFLVNLVNNYLEN